MTKLLAKDLVDGQGKGFLPEAPIPTIGYIGEMPEIVAIPTGFNRAIEEIGNKDLMPFIQASCEAVLCKCVIIWDKVPTPNKDCTDCHGTGAVIRKREGKQ